MATSQDVQAKIDEGVGFLKKTRSSAVQMIKAYGSDWNKWPKDSNWYKGMLALNEARKEVGLLNQELTAEFTVKTL